jgi:transposase-like protein
MSKTSISRRKHTAEFKAKVAFEALQERFTLSELSERHGIHPNLVSQWKKAVVDNGFKLFQDFSPKKDKRDKLIEGLYQEIGTLTMDLNFLKKKLKGYL